MIATLSGKGAGFTLTLAAVALATIAFVLLAAPTNAGAANPSAAVETPVAASAVNFNRNLTATQAAYGLRYQCMQDFRKCTRGIAVGSSWTVALAQEAFDAEYASCCYEAYLCGDFLGSIGSRTLTDDYEDDIDSACEAINDAESGLRAHAALIRKAQADAMVR